MKLAHKEGRASNWGKLRSRLIPSWPEQWFMKIIEEAFEDKQYEHEKPFNKFSLDFCWEHKKRVIEIDGEQHYKEGEEFEDQKRRDKEKEQLLKELGYELLRIRWSYCCNDPKLWIEKAKEFIDS